MQIPTRPAYCAKLKNASRVALTTLLERVFPGHYTIDNFKNAREVHLSCKEHGVLPTTKVATAATITLKAGVHLCSLCKAASKETR